MPTLPDYTSLGNLPSGQGNRAGANYNTPAFARPVDPVEAARGIKVDAPLVDSGAGLKMVGEGMQRAANAAAYYFGHEAAMQNRINEAKSDATYITEASKIKTAITQAASVEEVNALKQQLSLLPDAAAANLPEDQREYFKLKAAGHNANYEELANNRIYNINKNNEISAIQTKLNELGEAYKVGNKEERSYAHETAGMLYEQLALSGYYDKPTVDKLKDEWSIKAVKGQQETLPPAERIRSLGGVMPGTVAAGDLPVFAKAFLNGVAGPESAGRYNARYPGGTFDDYSAHPKIKAVIQNGPHAGETSDAAGRYQFLSSTWYGNSKRGDPGIASAIGATDFSPEAQDRGAWYLAQRDYKAKTGGDLASDLQKEGLSKRIMSSLGGTWEAWQSEAGQRKSIAAFNATLTGMPDVTAAVDSGDPDARVIPVEDRLQMLQKAIAENAKVTAAERAQITALNQDLKTDLDMVANSGIPLDGFRERYQAVYGQEGATDLDRRREAASTLFTTTTNMQTAPTAQLDMLAEQIKPTPDLLGTPIYEQLDKNYQAAVKAAADIKKARAEDIAAYSDKMVDPAIKEQAASGDMQAKKNLATARLRAQEQLGIPPERQVPVTKPEAKEIMSPVLLAMPGKEKDALNAVVPNIINTYGEDMAERVIGYGLNAARVDQETQEKAARIFKKLSLGQPVSETEVASLDTAKTNDAMAAAAGVPTKPAPTPKDAFPDYGASTTPEGETVAAEIARQNQPQFPVAPSSAINDLVAQPTPGRIKSFNKTFGPGAAERVLGASKQTTPGRLP